MKSLKLNTVGILSRLTSRSIRLGLLFASLTVCPSALAQNLQPGPVARLLPDPAAEARSSRPRRVKSEENSADISGSTEAIATVSFAGASAIERRAFEQTNNVRVENGLEPLVWSAELCRMARSHSERMALGGFFSHETPDGLHLKDRAHASGILHFRVIGENIAYNKGYDDPGGFAVERWMTSSGHRANILYGGFQSSAIGSYVSADGSTFLTQIFIAR